MISFSCDFSQTFGTCIYKLAYDWQTLIAGGLALFGAWITVCSIKKQIKQTDDTAKDKKDRDERAAKAVLPLGLSELSAYARTCIIFIDKHFSEKSAVPKGAIAPQLPPGVMLILQECVRHSDTQIASEIAILLGKLQIQHARLESLVARRQGEEFLEHEVANSIADAADIEASTGRLYAYARDLEGVRKRSPANELFSVLMVCGLSEDHPAMKEIFRREQAEKELSN